MKRLLVSAGLVLTVGLALRPGLAPVRADDAMGGGTTTTDTPAPITVSGSVTEPNFQGKTVWVRNGDNNVACDLTDATFKFNDKDANIYRMMGTPTASITGTMRGNLLYATSVTITSDPTAKLQQSSYTDQAIPPFTADQVHPRHAG